MNTRRDQKEEVQNEGDGEERLVTLGRISGVYGVKGWIKIYSETDPRERIVHYSPWLLERNGRLETWKVVSGRPHGKTVVAQLAGIEDRDQAAGLVGCTIQVRRSQLPAVDEPGEYYWADLEGLSVETIDGVKLGRIDHLFETGSNDVMVVKGERERLVPYIWEQVVREVDLAAGRMVVDWDPDF